MPITVYFAPWPATRLRVAGVTPARDARLYMCCEEMLGWPAVASTDLSVIGALREACYLGVIGRRPERSRRCRPNAVGRHLSGGVELVLGVGRRSRLAGRVLQFRQVTFERGVRPV